jgi:YaiO family outer membrane protein
VRLAACALALALPLVAHGSMVELSHGADALSGGRPAWRATALEGLWTGERGAAAGGGLRELSRFDRSDVDLSAFGQAPVAGLVLGAEASASPTWRFVPRWSAGARAERALGAGWVASAGARLLRYEGEAGRTTPLLASGGLERYFGRWRAAGVGTAVALEGEWSGGGRLALDLFYGDGGRVGASAAAGRELESLGGGRLLRTDVVGAGLAGAHPLGAGWALAWELSVQRQGDLYTRTGGRLGLRRRF